MIRTSSAEEFGEASTAEVSGMLGLSKQHDDPLLYRLVSVIDETPGAAVPVGRTADH